MKYLALLALILFVGWLVKRNVMLRIRRARGEVIEPDPGPRPITIIAGTILVVYGGYMLWYLLTQGFGTA